MTQEEYLALQHKNINTAIQTGQALLKTSFRLHNTCDNADREEKSSEHTSGNSSGKASAFSQDLFMYYDFSDAAAELSAMPKTVQEFKEQLVAIKIANDRMLMEEGYRVEVDNCIADIFALGTLKRVSVVDQPVLETIKDAVEKLQKLDAEL